MHVGIVTLVRNKISCTPMAGTAKFRMTPMNYTGDGPTHVGMVWNGGDGWRLSSHVKPEDFVLPEMHCWIWDKQNMEVVDFSAGEIPLMAKAIGLEWSCPKPPKYYWSHPSIISPDAIYIPHLDATRLALGLVQGTISPDQLMTAGSYRGEANHP